MPGYADFHAQTEFAVYYLYKLVIILLPILWLPNCKKAMSLLFTGVQMPNYEYGISFSPSLQTVVIISGLIAHYYHRRWRLGFNDMRCKEDCKTVSKIAMIVSTDFRTVSEDCKTASEDSKIVSADSKTAWEDAKIVSEDPKTVAEDSKTVLKDARTASADAMIVLKTPRLYPQIPSRRNARQLNAASRRRKLCPHQYTSAKTENSK